MVCKLVPSAVDCGYKPLSSQTKDYATGIFCFSAKHAALRRKSKDWLVGIRMMCPSGATLYAKRIGGEMVCKLVPSAVDCGYKPLSSQTKDYVTGIFCFSAKHAALRRKSKDWLVGIRMMCPSGATYLPEKLVSVSKHN